MFFSQGLLLELVRKGLSREKAYEIVQRNAMRCWKEGENFEKLVREDEEVKRYLDEEELRSVFELHHYLRNVDEIFKKVGI